MINSINDPAAGAIGIGRGHAALILDRQARTGGKVNCKCKMGDKHVWLFGWPMK